MICEEDGRIQQLSQLLGVNVKIVMQNNSHKKSIEGSNPKPAGAKRGIR